jgi:hypothetical protein
MKLLTSKFQRSEAIGAISPMPLIASVRLRPIVKPGPPYSDDDGLLVALRQGDYKYVFSEQRKEGTMGLWAEPFTTLRLQKIFNLMQDPFERADITSNTFWDWQINHVGSAYGMMDEVFKFVATFKDFPPRSFPPSFNPANVLESTMDTIKQKKALTESVDVERIRGRLNEMIQQQIQQRGVR